MFGIGMPEMILILAVALIVIGPKKLPDLAKSLGRALGEFKRATSDIKDSFDIDEDIKPIESYDNVNGAMKDTIDITPETAGDEETDPTEPDESNDAPRDDKDE